LGDISIHARIILNLMLHKQGYRSRGGSASIMSDYGLDDLTIGVLSPSETKEFSSSLCVKTGTGAYPPSYPKGTEVLSWG
jgi:hypothetical protein